MWISRCDCSLLSLGNSLQGSDAEWIWRARAPIGQSKAASRRCLAERGNLALAEASPRGLEHAGAAKLCELLSSLTAARAEENSAEIGATLFDVNGRNGIDVSAAISRDEDGDECFVILRERDDVILELKVRLLKFVRDDDALFVSFTADRRQTLREYPVWTLWPHDLNAYKRLLARLERVPDCCCVAIDACSVQSASRSRRTASRGRGD